MLDYLAIFTKGGALLWAWQLGQLKGDPVGALIRSCLLEDRAGEKAFAYVLPGGGGYTVKWSLHNALQLVVVAVYSKALTLLYVDQLLEDVKQAFAVKHYQPRLYEYPKFDATFRRLLSEAEAHSEAGRRPTLQQHQGIATTNGHSQQGGALGGGGDRIGGESADDEDGEGDASKAAAKKLARMAIGHAKGHVSTGASGTDTNASNTDDDGTGASGSGFDVTALARKGGRRRVGGARTARPADSISPAKPSVKASKKKEARSWSNTGTTSNGPGKKAGEAELDFSATKGDNTGGGASAPLDLGASLVDAPADDDYASDSDEDDTDAPAASGASKGGFLSTFARKLGVSVVGTSALTAEDIAPALDALRRKLMERNVASEIADKVVDSVRGNLEGRALGSMTRVSTAVRSAVEAALTRILTPKRSIDILREVGQLSWQCCTWTSGKLQLCAWTGQQAAFQVGA